MGWFQKIMRRTTSKLIRAIVNPKVFNIPLRKTNSVEIELKEFFTEILGKLEKNLVDRENLSGPQLTFIDIMFYVEIFTILKLYQKEITSSQHPQLHKWYEKVSKEQVV